MNSVLSRMSEYVLRKSDECLLLQNVSLDVRNSDQLLRCLVLLRLVVEIPLPLLVVVIPLLSLLYALISLRLPLPVAYLLLLAIQIRLLLQEERLR
jgi:hypothetical protein